MNEQPYALTARQMTTFSRNMTDPEGTLTSCYTNLLCCLMGDVLTRRLGQALPDANSRILISVCRLAGM